MTAGAPQMECPDENDLVAMLEHALDPAVVSALEVHFDSCERCGDMVALLAGARPTALGTPQADERWAQHALGLPPEVPTPEGRIAGRYDVRARLGQGGMGAVFLARDVTLDRDVAIKLHRAGSGDDRLHREARALAKLAHPNVVTVFEVGEHGDRLFVAMEYVRGTTLRAHLATAGASWRATLALLLDVGAGLAAAHAAGLIHRDFKPENVLVGEDGRPRVSDFGLARTAGPADTAAAAGTTQIANGTITGAVVGTPAYMAPEQLAGEPLDARCDQFAYCIVLWEALYGKRPFTGTNVAALITAIRDRRFERAADRGREVPDAVRRVLERGLALEPDERFPDVVALLAALRAAAAPHTRRRLVVGGAAVLALAGAAIPGTLYVRAQRAEAACRLRADEVRQAIDLDGVTRALAASGSPLGASAAERTRAVLARYTDVLARETEVACAAADEPLAVARRACLEERTTELAGFLEALAKPDPGMVMRAPAAAWTLFEPRPCAEVRPLAGPPSAPEHAGTLARARGLVEAGRYDDAVARLAPLVDATHRTGDRAGELAALLLLGEAHSNREAVDDALPILHRAQALAETLGRDLDAARALDELAAVAGTSQHDYAAGHRYVELARAKLARLGDGNVVARGALEATEAQIWMNEYRLDDAEASIARALPLLEQGLGPDHPRVGVAAGIASQIALGLGKSNDAVRLAERSLAILGAALGDAHPTVAGAQLTVAQGLLALERPADARTRLVAADAVFARAFGDTHPVRAAVAGNLGEALAQLGNWDASVTAFRRAVAVLVATQGEGAPSTAAARVDLAQSLAGGGQHEAALAELATAITALEALGDDGQARLRNALVARARTLVAAGRAREARPELERAQTLARKFPESVTPDERRALDELLAQVTGGTSAR